jgi:hypothetical protein
VSARAERSNHFERRSAVVTLKPGGQILGVAKKSRACDNNAQYFIASSVPASHANEAAAALVETQQPARNARNRCALLRQRTDCQSTYKQFPLVVLCVPDQCFDMLFRKGYWRIDI